MTLREELQKIIEEHREDHRTDNRDHSRASTHEIRWLRNISETLDEIMLTLSGRKDND